MSVPDRLETNFEPLVGSGNVLRVFVKICGITNADDALLAAGLGADAIGMVFAAASPRRISTGQASEIVNRLPSDVLAVGVFRNELPERVVEVANTVGLRAVQLHGHESPEETRWVGERVPSLIRAFSVKDPALREEADYGPHRLLVDSPMPGSGEVFDWAMLDRLVSGRRYILAGGLDPANVADAIEMLGPWGVDVSTGVESSPGRKDPTKVRRFLAAARAAAASIDNWDDEPVSASPARPESGSVDWPRPGVSPGPMAGRGQQPFDWEEDSQWR